MDGRRTLLAAVCLVSWVGCGGPDREVRVTIQNKGSDTLVNVALAWAEAYRVAKPEVAVAVTGGGSGTGIAALMNGTVDIANASREIKPAEAATAEANTGKKPVEHVVAYDALAIFVHPANPIAGISRGELACIYGEHGTCTKWSDLGVEVPGCAKQTIVRVSRQNNSGTYQFFRDWVVGEKGDFKLGSNDMQGSKDVVDLVGTTPCAIAFSGVGYKSEHVRALCVSSEAGDECVAPTPENTITAKYPIARGLYMYTLGEPTGDVATYLDWIMSDAGQQHVARAGQVPLAPAQRASAGTPGLAVP